jgi:hypothetical protein
MKIFVITGGVWPLEAVLGWHKYFCLSLPISIPIISIRAIMFRGWGLEHPVVLQGFGVSLAWIVMCLSVSIYMNKRKK